MSPASRSASSEERAFCSSLFIKQNYLREDIMEKDYKLGLILGRYNHIHNGHVEIINYLDQHDLW